MRRFALAKRASPLLGQVADRGDCIEPLLLVEHVQVHRLLRPLLHPLRPGFHSLVQFALPALAVGYRSSALIMRITRSSLLEVLREELER
mgnify:CR=1 FL=1